ncbi:hypothetical protein RZS08_40985, partial [Arthrospira platensis SPKY1]|nr:hypothetical protein [Arthrospira platensis SPKY1]
KAFTGQYFVDKNEAVGWVVGRNQSPMKDWKGAVRTWIANNREREGKPRKGHRSTPERMITLDNALNGVIVIE